MSDIVVKLENIVKVYGEATVLNDVSLEFEKGRIYGLVGRNGCGKTMLMKVICGFVIPTKGKATVLGKEPGRKIPDGLGVIIEEPGFLPGYSAYQNLYFLSRIRGKVGKKDMRRVLNEEDDVYMFRIPLAAEGYPLVQDNSGSLGGGYAEAMVGSTGLWYLQLWFPYEVTGVDSSETTISKEAALGLVEDYFSRMPNVDTEELTLTCQGFRYSPRIFAVDDCKLLPVWTIVAVRMVGETAVTNVFSVDAITGEMTAVT